MKILKRLFLYLLSVILLVCMGWMIGHAAGTVPQANTIFADHTVYEVMIPGALLVVFLMAGVTVACKKWEDYYFKIGITVVICLIMVFQFLYLYVIRIYISYDYIQALNEAVAMVNAQSLNPELYHINPVVVILYGLLRAVKGMGINDLRWAPCVLSVICMDIALLCSTKIVWKVKGCRFGFLFLVFMGLNPAVYIWLPWCYTIMYSMPFFVGSLYFMIMTGRAKTLGKRFGSLILVLILLGISTLILSTDYTKIAEDNHGMPHILAEIKEHELTEPVEILEKVGEKGSVMWQDGSYGYRHDWLYANAYSKGYEYLCGEKNDLFLGWMQMYYLAMLLLIFWGILSGMIGNQGGTWLFLRWVLLGMLSVYLLWKLPNGYSLAMLMLFGLLAVDGIEWIDKQREWLNEKMIIKGKWLGYLCGMILLGIVVGIFTVVPAFQQEVSWREYSVYHMFEKGRALKGLTDDDTVIQTFTADAAFDSVFVKGYFADPKQEFGGCLLEILDSKGMVLGSRQMTAQEIHEEYLYMQCDLISPIIDEIYTIKITPIDVQEENALCIQRFEGAMDLYPQGKLKQNHEYQNGDLVFSVYKDNRGTYFEF